MGGTYGTHVNQHSFDQLDPIFGSKYPGLLHLVESFDG